MGRLLSVLDPLMATTLSGYYETYIDTVSLSPWPISPGDIPMHAADLAPRGESGMSLKTLQGFTQSKPKGSRNHRALDISGLVQDAQRGLVCFP